MHKDRFGSSQGRTKEAAKKSPRSTANCYRERTDSAGDTKAPPPPPEERTEDEQEAQQTEKIEDTEQESEGGSQVIWGDNFPIVDLKAYKTEGKEIQFIQRNQIIEKITGDKKNTEDTIEKAEFNFMLDLKTLIAKSSTDTELNRVRDALRRGEKNTAPDQYRTTFEKLNNRWG